MGKSERHRRFVLPRAATLKRSAGGTWRHLGIKPIPASYDEPAWEQEAGITAFAPFPADTDYFGKKEQSWMVNFRVRDSTR